MSSAPSPYSPPIPIPALMTDGNTRTAADFATSSRDPRTCEKKSLTVAWTSASIRAAELASVLGADPIIANSESNASNSAGHRQSMRMAFPPAQMVDPREDHLHATVNRAYQHSWATIGQC